MRFISDKFGILDYSNQDVPIPRNDEVGRIQMKKNVVSAEDTLQKVKGTFAEKIGKIKKRCVVEGGEGGGGLYCSSVKGRFHWRFSFIFTREIAPLDKFAL
jgi:hypothetical protein